MKKISIFLALVALVMTLFAINVFAASFTRGPEGDTIAADDVESIELIAGSTHAAGYISVQGALDGNYSTWWGGPTGSKIKITFINEWEITKAEAVLSANWCGCKFTFYAADDTVLGSQGFGGYSSNTGLCWGGDGSSAARSDLAGAVGKISYGDNDKAVKYVIFENTGDKWGYLPMMAELIATGRERIPSEGCDSHEFAPYYPVEPGCETTGTVVNKCVKCGAEEAPSTVPALGHKMGEYTIKTPATCDTTAVIEYECERCGSIIVNQTYIKDVTDFADIYSVGANGAGGYTTSHQALFDNNMDSYLHASGGWFVESWIELDQAYYITSVTVWTDSWSDNNSWEAFFTFYYQAPGSDEWVTVSPTKSAGVGKAGEKNSHTLELATPVYADAIKIKVDRLCSFQGQAFEAEVAGTLVPEVAPLGHTWEVTGVVPSACYAGYTLSTCTTCGATKQDAFTKAVGHVWADATCIAPKTCTVCALTEGEAVDDAHFYDGADDAVCNGCDYVRGVARVGEQYFATLEEAIAAGDEIVVIGKVTVEGDATWNFAGKTITLAYADENNYAVVVKGDLTIVGGTYNVTGYFGFGVTGNLTINGGTFVAETADYLIGSWGTTTINGGSFKANYNCVNAFAGSVVINGGNFEVIDVNNTEWPAQDVFGEGVGTAVIYGGTFSTDIYAYLAETYHIDLDENGKYVAAPTIHVDAKAATCTTNGNVEYWYCETCELVWVDKALTRISNFKSVVVPAAHAKSVIKVVTEPTCTDPGEQENICSECGEVVSTETIAPVAHTVAHVEAKAPTCYEPGNIEHWYCTVCGFAWLDEACTLNTNLKAVVLPIAHNVEHVEASEPTCTEEGNIEYWYCSDCGYAWLDEACTLNTNLKAVVLPMAEHDYWQLDWSAEMKQPTCIEEGYETYKCDCGATKVVYYEPDTVDGHDWVINQETFVEATCIKDGYRERKCSLCNAEEAGALDKDIYGVHKYVTEEKPATCQEDGYTKTTCELCDYLYEEVIPANDWSHNYNYLANGIFKECAICGDWGMRDTIKGGNEEAVADYSIYFMGSDVINIYHTEDYSVLDEFYHYTIAKNEDGTYTLTIADCYNGNDTFKLANTTAKFEIVENGGILTFTNADGVVYTFDNIPEEEPITLNYETYAYYDSMDPTGETINFKVTFVGGYAYILVNTMFEGLSEKFWIEYNPDYGMIDTEIGTFFSISNNTLYLPRGTELTRVDFEMPEIEEPEVNYGDKIGSITVETTDTYGYFDLYSYTSTAAGKYSFFVPAGLGFYSKALFDTYAEAEVGFYDNEAGDYVSFDLAAGETLEFYVGSLVKDTWTIDVYYLAPAHVHTEVEIPAVLPTPSTTGYTAGIKCSECDEIIKAPEAIEVTTTPSYKTFGIGATDLILGNNISLDYKINVSEGYGTPYMVFVFEGKEYMVTEYVIEGARLVFNFAETRPHKIATNIEAYVYAPTADGYAVDKYDYSVMKYCIAKLKKNEYVDIISDLLVFGAETQKYVAESTHETVAEEDLITSIVEAQGYTLTPSTFTSIPQASKAQYVDVDANDDLTWKSSTVVLGSSTQMVYKFAANDITGLYIKIEVDGVEKMMIDASTLEIENGRYVVSVNCVSAVQYGSEVKATFVKNGVESDSVAYSINGFLYNNLSKNEGTVLGDLMKALYLYGNTTFNRLLGNN